MFLFGGPNIRKMAEDRDIDGLVGLLEHRSPQVRLEAAEVLAGLNEGRGWRYLLGSILDASDPLVQAATAEVLAGLGHPRAVPALHEAAQHARGEALDAIHEALEVLEGVPAESMLPAHETQPDASIIESLVSSVAGSGVAILGDFIEPTRPAAMEAGLIEIRTAEAHLQVAADLREAELQERGLVEARVAAWLRPDWAEVWYMRGVLLEDLEREREALLAYQAALSLDPQHANAGEARDELQASLGDTRLLPADLGSAEWRDRRDALATLQPNGEDVSSAVIACLADEEREVRHAAIEAAGRLGLQAAVPALLAQTETSWLLRFAIIDTLSTLGALSPLVDRLRDEMNQMPPRNPVLTGSKDPLAELEYDQLFEIGMLALERTGDVAGLLEQAEGNVWEEIELEGGEEETLELEALDSSADAEEYEEDEDEGAEEEAEEDLLAYVDETGLMISQALERLATRRLPDLPAELVQRLAHTPDLTLLDPTDEIADPQMVHDFTTLRAAAAAELARR